MSELSDNGEDGAVEGEREGSGDKGRSTSDDPTQYHDDNDDDEDIGKQD